MKRNVSVGIVSSLLVGLLLLSGFVHFFLIPFENRNHPTKLAKWTTRNEHFGLGVPRFGKSHQKRGWSCSGGCLITATQWISFGPFYYERDLKGDSDNPWNKFMDTDPKLNLGQKAMDKVFDELDQ